MRFSFAFAAKKSANLREVDLSLVIGYPMPPVDNFRIADDPDRIVALGCK